MNKKYLGAFLLVLGASPAQSQSRFPDFQAVCQELAQFYNGADGRSEWINFKNFHGHQENFEIKLRMREGKCVFNPESMNIWVEKVGALTVTTSVLITVNREAVGEDRLQISEFSSACEPQTTQHIRSILEADHVVINDTLNAQIAEHAQRDFCPAFNEKVKQSVLDALKSR